MLQQRAYKVATHLPERMFRFALERNVFQRVRFRAARWRELARSPTMAQWTSKEKTIRVKNHANPEGDLRSAGAT